jgi:hypothetical protein
VDEMKKTLQIGDYVLATKYQDGCPRDHFCVGFFNGMLIDKWGNETDRYMVVDSDGNNFRGNGFRRCERIQRKTGDLIVKGIPLIEQGCRSVWGWRRHLKDLERLIETC